VVVFKNKIKVMQATTELATELALAEDYHSFGISLSSYIPDLLKCLENQ
jgi:hypothetical protein